jgi:L-asparaginase
MRTFRFGKSRIGACAVASVFAAMGASAQTVSQLPIVRVISTGGTIAGSASSTSLSNYKPGALLGDELVRAVPEIKQYADVHVEQLFNVSSSDLTVANWVELANRINPIFSKDPASLAEAFLAI